MHFALVQGADCDAWYGAWRCGAAKTTVSLRQLNRWTLARQMLLEREDLDAVSALERLAEMQAQYSPSLHRPVVEEARLQARGARSGA